MSSYWVDMFKMCRHAPGHEAYVHKRLKIPPSFLPPGSVLSFTIQWFDNPDAFTSTTQSIIIMCLSAAVWCLFLFCCWVMNFWSCGWRARTHIHTLPASLFSLCSCVNTFRSQSHLPFWSSWVCHPFYKQPLMTSQQGSSLSEDREWFLVYIACLQCNDSSKASSGLWETLVVGFFYLYLFKGGFLSSFSAPL